ncbi:bifunctional (p)ppGpp synthetase/guanosine-3',5'-bis(diphosphate) 3'-pyrophosphohydrolase [Candidatus Woesearchaeota archaeon]|nr:bifunctional (p)ppGpp synthetase/guanosine-3',5'-bis(diphosphate) 3'-pyrophosphohydrolase [Candidatus Woesearchaeota archaeon]
MDEQTLLNLWIEKGYQKNLIPLLENALALAKEHLHKKVRLAGDSYYDHALRLAVILLENKADPSSVIAGIVQEVFSEKEVGLDSRFSREVVELARGVAEIKIIKSKSKSLQAESLRKIILATSKDLRVMVIKLACKLDNLRNIKCLPEEEQLRIAQEVIEFYAPIAYRLGMEKMKSELENLAFAIVNPKKYQEIFNYLQESQEEREKDVEQAIQEIKTVAKNIKILKIKGRPKHIYSIYKKITKRGVPLDEQFDLMGVRVIVPDVVDCYSLLALLHEEFTPLEGRLKDYIAKPKLNFYRSIHTTLQMPGEKIVEVQIRTPEMDEFAEEGIAAHWKYKGISSEDIFEKKMSWLRGVLELQKEEKDFLEAAKIDVFGDFITCYTPKGDIKELPEGSSVLDFAYLVHEQVGNTAIGGKVNGKFVPLKQVLSKGDIVEIVTNKNQRPRRTWLKIVKSQKTRQKIRKYLRESEKLPALFYHKLKPSVTEDQGILVESKDFPTAFCVLAKCCIPLPGEDIVGVVTKRRVISVHGKDCRLALKEESRWVNVQWKETFNQKIRFFVQSEERSGVLADILHTIVQAGFEVKEAKAKMVSRDMECSFLVIPRDLGHLKEMLKRVSKVKGVRKMFFE